MMIARLVQRLPGFLSDVAKFKRGGVVPPRLLTYTVTFRCNARCIMCDSWKLKGHNDLSVEEIRNIFTQLPKMDAVRLTGGEPFVRKDLVEIVELATRHLRPLGIHTTTNGFLTDRIVDLCTNRTKSVPLQVMVSIDGLADKHNHIRGNTNAYACAIRTLEELAPLRKKLNLDLAVNQTIVDSGGIEQYDSLNSMLRQLGVRHQVVMAYDASATYSVERGQDLAPREVGQFTSFGAFDQSDLSDFLVRAKSNLQTEKWWARWVKGYYLRGIEDRLLEKSDGSTFTNPKCAALRTHLRIFPNGDVPTCQFNSNVVGNLRTASFKKLWTDAVTNEQRQWVDRCAGCWAECEVIPSAIYSLDLLRRR